MVFTSKCLSVKEVKSETKYSKPQHFGFPDISLIFALLSYWFLRPGTKSAEVYWDVNSSWHPAPTVRSQSALAQFYSTALSATATLLQGTAAPHCPLVCRAPAAPWH